MAVLLNSLADPNYVGLIPAGLADGPAAPLRA
jgi:hypothetical protein